MKKLTASNIRALVRSAVVVATAFGFNLDVEQVAAVQIALEAVLQVFFKDSKEA